MKQNQIDKVNAYYTWMPDYTLSSGIHVCWFEQSDLTFGLCLIVRYVGH